MGEGEPRESAVFFFFRSSCLSCLSLSLTLFSLSSLSVYLSLLLTHSFRLSCHSFSTLQEEGEQDTDQGGRRRVNLKLSQNGLHGVFDRIVFVRLEKRRHTREDSA
jgi:hypothetical protein